MSVVYPCFIINRNDIMAAKVQIISKTCKTIIN